jgi:hypothetical protein
LKVNDLCLPEELDERLIEWARFFKDRHRYERAKSLEGRFEAASPGSWDEGWGSQDEIPVQRYAPAIDVLRALRTHAAVMELGKCQRWSITYGYCYPHLERWQVLKFLKKYTGERLTWKQYLNELDMGRMRVWARIA